MFVKKLIMVKVLKHISDCMLMRQKKGFKAYNKFNEIKNCDAIIICVLHHLKKIENRLAI